MTNSNTSCRRSTIFLVLMVQPLMGLSLALLVLTAAQLGSGDLDGYPTPGEDVWRPGMGILLASATWCVVGGVAAWWCSFMTRLFFATMGLILSLVGSIYWHIRSPYALGDGRRSCNAYRDDDACSKARTAEALGWASVAWIAILMVVLLSFRHSSFTRAQNRDLKEGDFEMQR